MKKSYRELLSNTAVFAISNLLSKALLMLLLPVYTHKLTTEQYGVVELATNVSLLIIPFVSLAVQDAVFRFTVDKSIDAKLVFKNAFWVLTFGTVMMAFSCAFLWLYKPLRDWNWWLWVFASLNMVRTALSLYAKGTNRTKIFAIDGVLYNATLAGANILLLVVLNLQIEGYFLSLIAAQTVSILYLLWHVEKPPLDEIFSFPLDFASLSKMLRYSAPLILNSISWNLAHTVDRLMLEGMRSTAEVGIYSAASKIPSLISTVMNIFIQAWTISAIRNFEDAEGKNFYARVFQYVQLTLSLVTIGVLLMNNRVVIILFGGDFKQALQYTPLLMLAASALFYAGYFGPIFSSAQKSETLMRTTLLGTIVNVVLNYLLIQPWGIFGACVATLASNAVVSATRIYLARKIYRFSIEWTAFAAQWGLMVAACAATLTSPRYAEWIDAALILVLLSSCRSQLRDAIQSVKGKRV